MGDGGRVLVIDPDRNLSAQIRMQLEAQGHRVRVLPGVGSALEEIGRTLPDLLLLDLGVAEPGGIELLRSVKRQHPEILVVLMTAQATTESAVAALRSGAHDYLIKPIPTDQLLVVVERAVRCRRMGEDRKRAAQELQRERARNALLRNELKGEAALDTIIGHSPAMKSIREMLLEVTRTDSTVLITGESGTGKGILARHIHYHSDRADKPFVEANCAIYSEGVLQSELFGHEKGAFTGAVKQKRGRFELAHEGTIFLDEIGDLSPGTQLMLLRVLQERKFERVGGEETLEADARVIAATNRDLAERMRREAFRPDLFYRLNVIPIGIPPLRDRREDIPTLAAAILRRCAARLGRTVEGFTPEAMDVLVRYAWPGNIREMENLIERTLILAKQAWISPEDLPVALHGNGEEGRKDAETWPSLLDHERNYIQRVLSRCDGNKKLAASVLGINRSSLYSKIHRLGIAGIRNPLPLPPRPPEPGAAPPPGGEPADPPPEEQPWKA